MVRGPMKFRTSLEHDAIEKVYSCQLNWVILHLGGSHLFAAQIFRKKCETGEGPELDAQASVFDETCSRLKEMTRSIFLEGRSCLWGVGEVSF